MGCDLAYHGVGRGDRDFVLPNPCPDRIDAGFPAGIADARAFLDEPDFLAGLDRSHPHRRLADIDEFDARKSLFELAPEFNADMIVLDACAFGARHQITHRLVIVITAPVIVGDVVAEGPAPGLAAIHSRISA